LAANPTWEVETMNKRQRKKATKHRTITTITTRTISKAAFEQMARIAIEYLNRKVDVVELFGGWKP